VLILPASEEVEDRAELPFVGTACAGASARLLGVIGRDALRAAIEDELAHLGQDLVGRNVDIALHAYDVMAADADVVTEGREVSASAYTPPDWVTTPLEGVERSAPSIHAAATSVQVRTGLWRTMRPVIDYDLCNRCWWVCSTFCPDSAIHVDEAGSPGIDYDHCKGCLICVSKCPPHAIAAIPEHQAKAAEEQAS
jgi:pyruvate ferredoxin oxidoreductase gamma subunit